MKLLMVSGGESFFWLFFRVVHNLVVIKEKQTTSLWAKKGAGLAWYGMGNGEEFECTGYGV